VFAELSADILGSLLPIIHLRSVHLPMQVWRLIYGSAAASGPEPLPSHKARRTSWRLNSELAFAAENSGCGKRGVKSAATTSACAGHKEIAVAAQGGFAENPDAQGSASNSLRQE
jgi:hypothetical protein